MNINRIRSFTVKMLNRRQLGGKLNPEEPFPVPALPELWETRILEYPQEFPVTCLTLTALERLYD